VLLYADVITDSIRQTLDTTAYRREKQLAYNTEHNITPRSVERGLDESLQAPGKQYDQEEDDDWVEEGDDRDRASVIAELEEEMLEAARNLAFEKAAIIRDQIEQLQGGADQTATTHVKAKKGRKRSGIYNAAGLPKKRKR
jgi:excinuclease ABC subunit B